MTTTGLQCPTCGHVHPLAEVPAQGRFRCAGCNRLLSVPESMHLPPEESTQAHQVSPGPGRSGQDGRPGATPASAPASAFAGPDGTGSAARTPAFIRAPVWILALALGFVVSAALLRAVGLLDVDAVLDAFAGEGVGRYSVLLVLLPLWAVLSAGGAHLVLEWAGRRRERRGRGSQSGPPGDTGKNEKPQSRKDEGARRAV